MGLFDKKQPKIGDPIFTDMRIAEEQLPEEVLAELRGQMWFMGYPEKLSDWAITTFGIQNHPSIQMVPQDADPDSLDLDKTIHPIHIPVELMDALVGKGDPEKLLLEFDQWELTMCQLLNEDAIGLMRYLTEKEEQTEKEFYALIVPDYSGASGAPGHDFHWYLLLHPEPINNLDYIVYGKGPMLGQPGLGGYQAAANDTLAIFNLGKAIPGLIKVSLDGDMLYTDYYLPYEVVEATGWWTDEVEGVATSMPRVK
jgi:hypothetical protein